MCADELNLICGTFLELEPAFLAQVRKLREAERLRPIAVVIPNRMLGDYLSQTLAEGGCPHVNIRFLTMSDLAGRLTEPGMTLKGWRMAPKGGAELAAIAALEGLRGKVAYFARIADREGFQRALLATIEEFKDAGLTPDELNRLASGLRAQRDSHLRTKLAEVALLWRRIGQIMQERKFYDEVDQSDAATLEAGRSRWFDDLAQFIVYGFYDLTGSQRRLLAACFKHGRATAYLPCTDGGAFRYARPALDWFRSLAGIEVSETLLPARHVAGEQEGCPAGDLARIQRRVFQRPSAGAEAPAKAGQELLVVSAPGEAREVEEIVREVLHSPEFSGEPAPRIGILLRSDESYLPLLDEMLRSVNIQAYCRHGLPLARTPAGRAALLLSGLAGGPLRRAEVMDFLGSVPLLCAQGQEMPQAHWSALTIRAGIVERRAEWEQRLESLETEARNPSPEGWNDDADGGGGGRAEDLRALIEFRRLLKGLFDGLEGLAAQRTWKGASAALCDLYRKLIATDDEAEKTLSVVEEMGSLDAISAGLTPDLFRRFLRARLEEERPSAGRFGRNEPTIAPLMAARGVTFDIVIVPGLVEKSFPLPAGQDPIVLDAERARLNDLLNATGNPLEIRYRRRRRASEEDLLFALAVQSARRRLVLTFPRLDAAKARPRIASCFLLRAVEALTDQPAGYAALDAFVANDPRGRFVRLTRLNPKAGARAVSAVEYDLSACARAVEMRKPEALLYLRDEAPFFRQALEAENLRWGRAVFSKYDGVVESRALLEDLGKRLYDEAKPVSATRLEAYAACPFDYLMRHVFHVEPVEEPEAVSTLSALDRGSLLHGILWQFLSEAAREKTLPLTQGHWPRLEAVARTRLEQFERRGVTGYPLMWRIEKEQMLADLREFLRLEIAEGREATPAYFEVRFGMPARGTEESPLSTSDPVALDLGGATVQFSGRVDRIDLVGADCCRVIDYKSGTNYLKLKDDLFHGGRALQLPVYLIAVARLMPDRRPERAEYYYAGSRGGWKRVQFTMEGWDAKLATLKQIVRTIVGGIRSGRFYARPGTDACANCDNRLACCHGRFLEFKWAAPQPATEEFKHMMEIP